MKRYLILFFAFFFFSNIALPQSNLDANGNYNINHFEKRNPEIIINTTTNNINSPIIVHRIPSPTTSVCDIAYDGKYLWVEGYNDYLIFRISTVDGSILSTIPTGIQRPYGLEFADGYLWIADTDHHLIQKVDTSNGNVLFTFPTPGQFLSSYPTGLAWDGLNLWHNDAMYPLANLNDSTYKLNTNGQILEKYHGHGKYVSGLAWDGNYLWSSDNYNRIIYKIDVSNFTIIDSIDAPGGDYPNGLAIDGQYLWVSNNDADSIYKINIGYTNTGVHTNLFSNHKNFSIYPNPASDYISIKLSKDANGSTYNIKDELGRLLMMGKLEDPITKIDLSPLTEGIYLIQVEDMKMQSLKIIKE